MNFFGLDAQDHRIIASPMIWIYVIASVLLTGATLVLYYFLLHGQGKLFQRLVPNVQFPGKGVFATLTRRLTRTKSSGFEMHELPR